MGFEPVRCPGRWRCACGLESLVVSTLTRRRSLREQVGATLRAAIISGQMAPGETYSAPAIADQIGVSSTPVREAMHDLINEGMVIAVANKGFRILEISDSDLDELTELRMLIEVPTVARLAATITGDAIIELRGIVDIGVSAAMEHDTVAYAEHDLLFHTELLRHAGNRRLVDMVRQLRTQTRPYALEQLADGEELLRSANEHLQILEALGNRDGARADVLMRQHLIQARADLAGRSKP